MRNWPLALKIWLLFAGMTVCFGGLLALLLPWTLKDFFTAQIYDLLLDSQSTVRVAGATTLNPLSQASGTAVLEVATARTTAPQPAQEKPAAPLGEAGEASDGTHPAATQAGTPASAADGGGAESRATGAAATLPAPSVTVEGAAAGASPTGEAGPTGGQWSAVDLTAPVILGPPLSVSSPMKVSPDAGAAPAGSGEASISLIAKDALPLIISFSESATGEEALPGELRVKRLSEARPMTASPATAVIAGSIGPLEPPSGPVVRHLLLEDDPAGNPPQMANRALPAPFLAAVRQDAQTQQTDVQQYNRSIENKTLFYVIRKEQLDATPGYVVSYAWGNYRNDLVLTMSVRLLLLLGSLIVVSWLPCVGFARYLSRPLVQMERHVGRLAERDWHEPLATGSSDEIGRLGRAIETMRRRLVKQDESQQFFLQNLSHELKTPVMVIRSYAQSMEDGVFPKGSLQDSVAVIMKEAGRLEKRIRDLLYLNKLTYFASRERAFEPFALKAIVEETVGRLRARRMSVAWRLDVPELTMNGDRAQWGVALENVLDNQLRYARSEVHIRVEAPTGGETAGDGAALPVVRIWNDGPPLPEGAADTVFEPFASGAGGEYGLGLAIVKQIAAYHGMAARAANEDDGVAFYLEPLPSKPASERRTA